MPEYINQKTKEEISKEGFEGDVEGGAAVVIGTKEEAERFRQMIEQEGRAVDLETYILLHKRVLVPKEEIEDEELKNLEPGTAVTRLDPGGIFNHQLRYIDREGNIAEVEFDPKKIEGGSKFF